MNDYAENPCFWVDYSIEKKPRQVRFVRQKTLGFMQKIQENAISAKGNISCVTRRRRVSVENGNNRRKRQKRRWIFWLLFGEKEVDCGGENKKTVRKRGMKAKKERTAEGDTFF